MRWIEITEHDVNIPRASKPVPPKIVETMQPSVPLFHGTSAAAAIEIIHTNSFIAEDTHGDGKGLGPSLTRNLGIAKRFADIQSDNARVNGAPDWAPGYAEHLVDGTDGVILIIDRAQVANKLISIPKARDGHDYNYEIDGVKISDEEEERILADADLNHIPNARNYIVEVQPVNAMRFRTFLQKLIEIDPDYRSAVQFIRRIVI